MTSSRDFKNQYPIILVHGFTGWGRDEVLGFKYWGGLVDIEAELNDKRFHTRTAVVGPVSSSWERSVDLYHYLVGGRVDYGAAHANKYGVKRFGHIFPGIYPQISEANKIHLVGHSMGGQTICDFESFLHNGSQEERDYHKAHPEEEPISDLFLGGKNWVHSITGLAPALNGTPAADVNTRPGNMTNMIRQAMLTLASTQGADPWNFFYDFKLDHWGFKREPDEPFTQYLERIFESALWKSSNVAVYDLSASGAARVARERLRIFPDTYYFTFSGKVTFTDPKTKYAVACPSLNPALIPTALDLGRMDIDPELPGGLDAWRNSDGLIACAAGRYVIGQPHREADPDEMTFQPGIWNAFPTMNGWDHYEFVGVGIPYFLHRKSIMPFYENLARILASTETAEGRAASETSRAQQPSKTAAKLAHKAATQKPAAHAAVKSSKGAPKSKR